MSYLSFHRLYFDFPGFLTFLENGRRRRGWITFTIRCFYRQCVNSLSLHFCSCFLVKDCNNNNDDSTSFLLQIETKLRKRKTKIEMRKLCKPYSIAESIFPSGCSVNTRVVYVRVIVLMQGLDILYFLFRMRAQLALPTVCYRRR